MNSTKTVLLLNDMKKEALKSIKSFNTILSGDKLTDYEIYAFEKMREMFVNFIKEINEILEKGEDISKGKS